MSNDSCAFCSARKKVGKLMLAVNGSTILGIVIGEWLRPLNTDLAFLAACIGFAGSVVLTWDYHKASKHFEEVKRQQHFH